MDKEILKDRVAGVIYEDAERGPAQVVFGVMAEIDRFFREDAEGFPQRRLSEVDLYPAQCITPDCLNRVGGRQFRCAECMAKGGY